MADLVGTGQAASATKSSNAIAGTIAILFAAVQHLAFGNAFSNANRAADHCLAWGSEWSCAPAPATVSGQPIPTTVLRAVATELDRLGTFPQVGYLRRAEHGSEFKVPS